MHECYLLVFKQRKSYIKASFVEYTPINIIAGLHVKWYAKSYLQQANLSKAHLGLLLLLY